MATEAGADIAYYEVEIKQEPVDVEIDCKETQQISCDAAVKEEMAVGTNAGCEVTEVAVELYRDHMIKQETDMYPEVLQQYLPSDTDASKECLNTLYTSEVYRSTTSAVMNQREDNPLQVHVYEHSHAGDNSPQYDILERKFTTKSDLPRHEKIASEKSLCCKICKKQFVKKSDLTQHEQIHTRDERFCCRKCGKHLSSKNFLKRHELNHIGDESLCCKYCGKQCTKKSILIDHQRTHTGEKPFSCKVCGKLFTQKYNLNKHAQIHSREKLFCCEVCKKQFTTKADLIRHGFPCGDSKMASSLFVRIY